MNEQPPFAVPADLLNRIATYLATRPFSEVVQMMAELQSVRPVEAPSVPGPIVDPGAAPAPPPVSPVAAAA